MKILYDGWPLIYRPDSPAALHLLGILTASQPDIEPHLALPGEPPAWLPEGVSRHIHAVADRPRLRLAWEQRLLPDLLRQTGAVLLHATSPNPPLFARVRSLVSPAGFEQVPAGRSFWERLRLAAAQGGMSNLGGLFWPDDLPPPQADIPVHRLPPLAYPTPGDERTADDASLDGLDLPEGYVLYHGPSSEAALRRLLSAWSWAAAPLGDIYPLVAVGLDRASSQRLLALSVESGLGDSVRSLPGVSPESLGRIYQRSAALFHPAEEPPWGGPVRLALAHGRPVVSAESARTSALVGPAAYLVNGEDSRLLGAALITVLVEEGVAGGLEEAGKQRAAAWSLEAFGRELSKAYYRMVER